MRSLEKVLEVFGVWPEAISTQHNLGDLVLLFRALESNGKEGLLCVLVCIRSTHPVSNLCQWQLLLEMILRGLDLRHTCTDISRLMIL